ncbi:hypothetical protein [Streptomyces sp. NPDC002994]|uniref:hypothetical protein n=1 Tax=Streptomyces sp. NPDC002994 TaxID=3154441 RepID=UPI0033ACEBDC
MRKPTVGALGKQATSIVIISIAMLGLSAPSSAAAPGTKLCADSSTNVRDIDLPGQKPDTKIAADVCVSLSASGHIQASTTLTWAILEDQVQDRSKRFTSFTVTTRAEKRQTSDGADNVVASTTCDFTKQLNDAWANATGLTCAATSVAFDPSQWWSSDTTVVYNVEGDNKGAVTWQLGGSPLIH